MNNFQRFVASCQESSPVGPMETLRTMRDEQLAEANGTTGWQAILGQLHTQSANLVIRYGNPTTIDADLVRYIGGIELLGDRPGICGLQVIEQQRKLRRGETRGDIDEENQQPDRDAGQHRDAWQTKIAYGFQKIIHVRSRPHTYLTNLSCKRCADLGALLQANARKSTIHIA